MKIYQSIMLAAGTCLIAASQFATSAASAQTVSGTITVCYYSPNCAYAAKLIDPPMALRIAQAVRDSGEHMGVPAQVPGKKTYQPVDAPAFQIKNTGTVAITDAKFAMLADPTESVPADSFKIGTIQPGKTKVIIPGASNDKKVHPTGGIFVFSAPGNPLDTSDSVPNSNAVVFVFTGKVGTQTVTSGNIVVGNSVAASNDGTVASLNFLGGPGNADTPCNDCVDPKIIATIGAAAGLAGK